jgi:hypothetical protein
MPGITKKIMIPKVQNSEKVTKFVLISLCNMLYKVISKILVGRLNLSLPEITTHSGFGPGCLIAENELIAYEINFHTMTFQSHSINSYKPSIFKKKNSYKPM